jgi:dephospho-CoA kinase
MIKLALTGKMRTGKDYLAEALSPEYNLYRLAFGDELKRHAKAIFPQQFEANEKPRQLIQDFGQSMRRLDSDVWVRPVIDKIRTYGFLFEMSQFDGFVITDLRQPNEFDALKAEGFVIVRVSSPLGMRIERMQANGDAFDPKDLEHETESYIDGFDVDYEITNYGNDDAVDALKFIIRKEFGSHAEL